MTKMLTAAAVCIVAGLVFIALEWALEIHTAYAGLLIVGIGFGLVIGNELVKCEAKKAVKPPEG
jgi:hypothetical protein